MNIKQELEKLVYDDVLNLWELWINQNADLPDKSAMINELVDMANQDEIAAAELLSEITTIYSDDKPEPKQHYVSECPDTKRQFLVQTGKDGNIVELTSDNISAMGLVPFLAEQYKHYQKTILPFCSGFTGTSDNETEFSDYDNLKNDFLESLWDVISQHFDDVGKPEPEPEPDGVTYTVEKQEDGFFTVWCNLGGTSAAIAEKIGDKYHAELFKTALENQEN